MDIGKFANSVFTTLFPTFRSEVDLQRELNSQFYPKPRICTPGGFYELYSPFPLQYVFLAPASRPMWDGPDPDEGEPIPVEYDQIREFPRVA